MSWRWLIVPILLASLIGCSASQTQVMQDKIFAWDDGNYENSKRFAVQVCKHWQYNYTFIDQILEGNLQTQGYYSMKASMDKILAHAGKTDLNPEEVAIVNANFAKFIQYSGERLVKEGLPNLLSFVASFRKFFGI